MIHPERQLEPGQVIAACYRLEEPIGRGAMGAVWRAMHLRLDAPVAIKFLNPAIASEPAMHERFMREARSAAAVRSSHVVQIFDYGVDAGAAYIVMELLVGEALDARLAARGRLAPPELDKIFEEVAHAVGVAHELGVVHRDIKPANIFIAREGGRELTKVLDFGIAKLVDRRLGEPAGGGTQTGILLGTPNYMSPEQVRGERTVDHRSDLWALAVLAFECLTGRLPFESGSVGDLVVKICTTQPLVPSTLAPLPQGFDAWFARGIDKDPAARFYSAAEMAEALHALLVAEGLAAESRPPLSPARRLELVPSEGPSGTIEGLPSSLPLLRVTSDGSLSANAAEVRAKGASSRRRQLQLVAIPLAFAALAALGIALATSSASQRASSLPAAAQSPAAAHTPTPTPAASPGGSARTPSIEAPSVPRPGDADAPLRTAPTSVSAMTPPPNGAASAGDSASSAPSGDASSALRPRRPPKRRVSASSATPAPAVSRSVSPSPSAPRPSIDPYADRL